MKRSILLRCKIAGIILQEHDSTNSTAKPAALFPKLLFLGIHRSPHCIRRNLESRKNVPFLTNLRKTILLYTFCNPY